MRPDDQIVHVEKVEFRVAPYDWPFLRDEAVRMDAHWSDLCRQKPKLYDGRVLLASEIALTENGLCGTAFETSFKSFLCWRDFGFPGPPVANFFAMAAIRSADGAFMLGEMSAHTSNAGRLYFPAGTPEPADVDTDGRVDLEGSALRELEEETGLPANEVRVAPDWTIAFGGAQVGCMKRIDCEATAAELQARLSAFNAAQEDPELARLVPVRSRADYDPARMPGFVLRYLDAMLAP